MEGTFLLGVARAAVLDARRQLWAAESDLAQVDGRQTAATADTVRRTAPRCDRSVGGIILVACSGGHRVIRKRIGNA